MGAEVVQSKATPYAQMLTSVCDIEFQRQFTADLLCVELKEQYIPALEWLFGSCISAGTIWDWRGQFYISFQKQRIQLHETGVHTSDDLQLAAQERQQNMTLSQLLGCRMPACRSGCHCFD